MCGISKVSHIDWTWLDVELDWGPKRPAIPAFKALQTAKKKTTVNKKKEFLWKWSKDLLRICVPFNKYSKCIFEGQSSKMVFFLHNMMGKLYLNTILISWSLDIREKKIKKLKCAQFWFILADVFLWMIIKKIQELTTEDRPKMEKSAIKIVSCIILLISTYILQMIKYYF